jgi:hypothetical protein
VVVQLERIALHLRARSGWEAIDLGFSMATAWWRSIWLTWCVVFWPLALVLHLALPGHTFMCCLILWWFKPLIDRFVLHVLSRSVFGDQPLLAQTLSAWRSILSPGLWSALTWQRPFDWFRSFMLPVAQLEKQRGKGASDRKRVLGQRLRGHALMLGFVCLLFELVVQVGLLSLLTIWFGSEASPAELFEPNTWIWDQWNAIYSIVYVLAVTFIEPFYVASGFSLYLNRRVVLEAWDIELALRRLAVRLQKTIVPVLCLLMMVGFVLSYSSVASAREQHANQMQKEFIDEQQAKQARPVQTRARQVAIDVLSQKKFGYYQNIEAWRLRKKEKKEEEKTPVRAPSSVIWALSSAAQTLGWALLVLLVLVVIWGIARKWAPLQKEPKIAALPTVLFGLSIAPTSLPDDVGMTALDYVEAGRIRDALSLIYRGALSYLVHQKKIKVTAGATEGDVLRLAVKVLESASQVYFSELINLWISVAYADRLPDAEQVRALCLGYNKHCVVLDLSQSEANLGLQVST